MSKIMLIYDTPAHQDWAELLAATLAERDPLLMAERLHETKDAVMDRIEDTGDSSSQVERKLLLAAMRTLRQLENTLRDVAFSTREVNQPLA